MPDDGGLIPILAVGASAGGIEALRQFFSSIPENPGIAFVVIVHSLPDSGQVLDDVLAQMTSLPVSIGKTGDTPVANHVYIAPPDALLAIRGNRLETDRRNDDARPVAIDHFFISLAEHHGRLSAAAVLSGTGTDGTRGIRAICDYEGTTAVQDPETAAHSAMPISAIRSGYVDFVLPADQIASQIIEHQLRTIGNSPIASDEIADQEEADAQALHTVIEIIKVRVGHDFNGYKRNTILRRLARRMSINRIEELSAYIELLRTDDAEQKALFEELLIGVTAFFREPESLQQLSTRVFSVAFDNSADECPYRVWIAGCSTGQEAYSIAILLSEAVERTRSRRPIQIFATDVDQRAIDFARKGVFPPSIEHEIQPRLLTRYFTREGDSYRVQQRIRDTIVFSTQDVVRDAPFSKIDLLLCRNVMIYLESELQTRLLTLFHFSLNPGGTLLLGTSETVGHAAHLYDAIDSKAKIFRRSDVSPDARGRIELPYGVNRSAAPLTQEIPAAGRGGEIEKLVSRIVAKLHGPTAILVDTSGTIIHIHGKTKRYLEMPSGPPSRSLIDLAHSGLRGDLSSAIRIATMEKSNVIRRNVRIAPDENGARTDIFVYPISHPKALAGRILVVFLQSSAPVGDSDEGETEPSDDNGQQRIPDDRARTSGYAGELSGDRRRTRISQ
jgi:two-component system CheB/CheR fusion protein